MNSVLHYCLSEHAVLVVSLLSWQYCHRQSVVKMAVLMIYLHSLYLSTHPRINSGLLNCKVSIVSALQRNTKLFTSYTSLHPGSRSRCMWHHTYSLLLFTAVALHGDKACKYQIYGFESTWSLTNTKRREWKIVKVTKRFGNIDRIGEQDIKIVDCNMQLVVQEWRVSKNRENCIIWNLVPYSPW
jgi:hypothetical protein